MDVKKFWDQNRQRIMPALTLTKKCLEDVIEMRRRPNVIDYVNLGFSFKENFENAYNLKDPYTYFNNPKWKFITSDSMGMVVCNLVQASMKSRVVPVATSESVSAFIGEIEGIRFGWIFYEDEADKLYVEKSAEDKYIKVLEKIFWEGHPSNHAVLGVQGENDPNSKIYIKEDDKGTDFTPTPLAKACADDIRDYLKHGICRSILFYGPPGTGKSNLVKNICFELGLRTIRINNISQLSTDTVSEIIKIFNPNAVVLEDIDKVPSHDLTQLLDKFENFGKQHILCFATANKLAKLDNAIIRPERFDQLKKVFSLEKEIAMNLISGDEAIYELVKDWPAVSITELMKRVKVKGKEYALANMEDLVERVQKIQNTNYDIGDDEGDEESFEEDEEPISTETFLKRLRER